ncbi:hypothetical protein [Phaeodactylibacter luteus]|uniref:Uncharacterized protein n=1 Tax=Phaeodactylibacter luteus TaxID=1564516 RepID=A0A5C6S0Q3_9BACT|nr:hypothetical protein [Phaeodactylibacter luteus]TXB67943.1 hypothetical protein FRY97_03605 [Phaeodactylibacter luteus]
MHTSIIKVYNGRYGKWEKNAKVTLHWGGLLNSGFSKAVYTNAQGIAEVQHASTGPATIYVNGKEQGKMRAPGTITVTI